MTRAADRFTIVEGEALESLSRLPDGIAQAIVTSPPYWGLRDYDDPRQLGGEAHPDEFVARLVRIFREARRVLRDDGTLWLNLGDSYATGAGKVGEHPGGGEQGKRGKRIAPRTQPNRLPLDGLKRGDLVLDVFNGSGTTGVVALNLGRRYLGLELNHEYATKSRQRLAALQARLDARAERKATKAAKSRGAKA